MDAINPGAVSAPGRAYGAPIRPPFTRHAMTNDSNSDSDGASSSSLRTTGPSFNGMLSSSRRWVSNRVLGRGITRASANEQALDIIAENHHDDSNTERDMPLAAEVVESPTEMEERVRTRLMMESTEASVVLMDSKGDSSKSAKMQRNVLAVVVVAIVVGLIVFFTTTREDETPAPTMFPSMAPTKAPFGTLAAILDRGHLECCASLNHTLGLMEVELVSTNHLFLYSFMLASTHLIDELLNKNHCCIVQGTRCFGFRKRVSFQYH